MFGKSMSLTIIQIILPIKSLNNAGPVLKQKIVAVGDHLTEFG